MTCVAQIQPRRHVLGHADHTLGCKRITILYHTQEGCRSTPFVRVSEGIITESSPVDNGQVVNRSQTTGKADKGIRVIATHPATNIRAVFFQSQEGKHNESSGFGKEAIVHIRS